MTGPGPVASTPSSLARKSPGVDTTSKEQSSCLRRSAHVLIPLSMIAAKNQQATARLWLLGSPVGHVAHGTLTRGRVVRGDQTSLDGLLEKAGRCRSARVRQAEASANR